MPRRLSAARLQVSGLSIVAALALTLAGCNTSESFNSVEGQVKYNGKALPKGAVIFLPDVAKGNNTKQEPRGEILDGKYQIMSHPNRGAPVGWYKVAVKSTEPSDPKNPYSEPRSLIPDKFGNPDTSNLTMEVKKNAPPGAYDIDLK